mgnify:FL=1
MLIKTIRHKHRGTIRHLLRYMVEGMEREEDMMIAHNLPSFDVEEMTRAILANEA